MPVRTRASAPPAEIRPEIKPQERTLSDIHLLILDSLKDYADFVDTSQFLMSLEPEDESMAQMAVMAIEEMVQGGLIAVKGRSKIKVTALGKERYEKEKRYLEEDQAGFTS